MRWLPLLAFFVAGLLLASCHQTQQVHSPPPQDPQFGGIAVGQTAPDIDGEDMEGERFKLSDYRGKVVAVVFWGTWCGPCQKMIPHERELVARLQGQRFALLGVNCDGDRDRAKNFSKSVNITWRMWWDGSAPGPIAQQYQVQSWPAIFVLDAQGVVRYRNVRGVELDRAVDTLLRELPAPQH